ncbi:MAG: transglutaminase domain-containing protein [Armatimonadetes bacterium]|nr:transglutaminase domain-containing protein [Armatimonadota bacterium]
MNGQLALTEEGRVVPMLSEPLTAYRRARKILMLPKAEDSGGSLHCLVWSHPGFARPLRVSINGHEFVCEPDADVSFLHWLSLPLPAGVLRDGENTIELWTDAQGQVGWSLALETGHRDPRSYASSDGGKTWRNERMGLHQAHRGEYVVRLSLSTSIPVPLPRFVWERPDHERLTELRALLPADITKIEDPWLRARALATWVSQAWTWRNTSPTGLYTPWDPFTILSWNEGVHVPGGSEGSIRSCVHYGVTFACACLACGLPARCVIGAGDITSLGGHFVCEVWHLEYNRWCMVDPNLDMCFVEKGRPLGAEEIYDRRASLRSLADYGPGVECQLPRLGDFLEQDVLEGKPYRLTGLWCRNDFLSRPDLTPPAHGHQAYCETGIVWRNHNVEGDELGMFPFVAEADYFNEPPTQEWL